MTVNGQGTTCDYLQHTRSVPGISQTKVLHPEWIFIFQNIIYLNILRMKQLITSML